MSVYISLLYNNSATVLPSLPDSFENLNRCIKSHLKLSNDLKILFITPDNDKLLITNDESYQDLLSLNSSIQFEIRLTFLISTILPSRKYDTFDIRKAINSLKGVFCIIISNRVIGMGILTTNRLCLTTSKVLPTFDSAKNAYALFATCSFQHNFDPDSLFISNNELTLVCFAAPSSLIDFTIMNCRNFSIPKENDEVYTLDKPNKQNCKESIKLVTIRETLGNKYFYDSLTACGPSGSPVFDRDFNFIGIQITECEMNSVAISCWEIYPSFQHFSTDLPILADFLSVIKPIRPRSEVEEYQSLLEIITEPTDLVFGVSSKKDYISVFDPRIKKHLHFTLDQRLSEGYSLCGLPFGISISGGRYHTKLITFIFLNPEFRSFPFTISSDFYTHCSIFIYPNLLLIGGRNETSVQNSCVSVNIYTRDFCNFYSLNIRRAYPTAAEVNGRVYVIGGKFEQDLDSIELLGSEGWEVCRMKLPQGLFGAAAFWLHDEICVFGGMYEGHKYNERLFKLNLLDSTSSSKVIYCKIGVVSANQVLRRSSDVYVFNQNCELLRYDLGLDVIKKFTKPIAPVIEVE